MKKSDLLFFCIFSIFACHLSGQEEAENYFSSKNEVNIVVDDFFAKDIFIQPNYFEPFLNYLIGYDLIEIKTPKIGLGYKYNFLKSALRSKVSVGYNDNNSESPENSNTSGEEIFTADISVGLEFHKNSKRSQIFYGFDGFLNHWNYHTESSYVSNNQTYTSDTKYNISGFGIRALLGIKYFISTSLSFSTEIYFNIESYNGAKVYMYSGNTQGNETTISGINTGFGPMGQISVNIHL